MSAQTTTVQPWHVSPQGHIAPPQPDSQLNFSFRIRGVSYQGHVHIRGRRVVMHISADLAAMPYSVESPTLRQAVWQLVGSAKRHPWGGCRLSRSQRVVVDGVIDLQEPFSPLNIVGSAIRFALQSSNVTGDVRNELRSLGVAVA